MTALDITKLYERDDLSIDQILDLLDSAGIPGYSWDMIQRERKAHRKMVGLPSIKPGPKPRSGPTSPIVAQPTVPGQTELIIKFDEEQFGLFVDLAADLRELIIDIRNSQWATN